MNHLLLTQNNIVTTINNCFLFCSYDPPITPKHHTCVGLALELWTKLDELDMRFPNLTEHLYLVSCEESIDMPAEYVSFNDRLNTAAYSLEKEHVLLALKVEIHGRNGVLLCDPGYHVGRVITIMCDGVYPHTGTKNHLITNNNNNTFYVHQNNKQCNQNITILYFSRVHSKLW